MDDETPPEEGAEAVGTAATVPLAMVLGRIIVVSGMGFAAAFAIFFLVGGLWVPGLGSALAAGVFLALMFLIERGTDRGV